MKAAASRTPAARAGGRPAEDSTTIDELARVLDTELRTGLTIWEASARLARVGANELPAPPGEAWTSRLARHLMEPMALLLLGAAGVSGFGLGKRVDAGVILAIVAVNTVIALVQEGRASRALEALRTMETSVATLVRAGERCVVDAREIVPGDIVLLAAGDRIPADLRLAETNAVEVDESLLTGESLPVAKDARAPIRPGAALGDQQAMAFSGTLVVRGSARGVAVATGPGTQLGAIASHLQARATPTPLQRQLRRMTLRLGVTAVGVAGVLFGVTLLRLGVTRSGLENAFLSAAALAVAAVPEGLPTVVTVALALGVKRMAHQGAIVRRLPAVETLGSTTVILTDKTGTLTENRMRVTAIVRGDDGPAGEAIDERVARVMALCNDATLDPPTGDPTEIALLEALGTERVTALRASSPRTDATPFDPERKLMASANAGTLSVKGAPEVVLTRCTRMLDRGGGTVGLDEAARARVLERTGARAEGGARVLALADRPLGAGDDLAERDLTLVALVALRDPARAEAPAAIAEAAGAGVHVLMVTGDHPGTARAIARDVGLAATGEVITGANLRRDGIPSDPLDFPVYARVDPDGKLALTEALQARGHTVAVTGDGVNDAPALRRADIGVAMGRTGSDVAREAADMIVTDDNLATIISAVREGRGIYDNVRKVVDYLVAGNLSEILVVLVGLALFPELGVPLLPLQLLWVNLLTDGFPALALGIDPVDHRLMRLPPRSPGDQLLSGPKVAGLLGRALWIAGASIGSLAAARYVWDLPWEHARAVMFSALVAAHLLYAFAVRGGVARNPWLGAAVAGGIGLQAIIVFVPVFHAVFGTVALGARELALIAVAGLLPMIVIGFLARGSGRDGPRRPGRSAPVARAARA